MSSVTLNGLTMRNDDETATYFLTAAPSGFGTTARGGRVDAAGGGRRPVGRDVPESRILTFECTFKAPTVTAAYGLGESLIAAWQPTSSIDELEFVIGELTRIKRGRSATADVDYTLLPDNAMGVARVTFEALDPVWYAGGPTKSAFVSMPTSGDGVLVASSGVLVASSGVLVTGGGVAGDAPALNAGKVAVDWTVQIVGPVTNPRITINSSIVSINGDIPAGSVATLDSRRQRFTLDGVMRPWVAYSSQWSKLPPGIPVTFSLRGDSGTGTALLAWRDGYP